MTSENINELKSLFYRSVEELCEPVQARIIGDLPKWIKGTLLRNGPGKFEIEDTAYRHLFDGLALLQQFVIKDGEVTYFNKFLRSQTYQRNMKAGKIIESELGTPGLPDPCKNIFARWFTYFFPKEYTDNASVNFCCIQGKIYAMTEVPIITQVDPNNLESVNRVKLSDGFQDAVTQLFFATAHPHEDDDGSVYNFAVGYDKKIGLAYLITMIPPNSADENKPLNGGKTVATIPASRQQTYTHSFGMTQKYFIFIQQPLSVNLWKLAASRFTGWSILETFAWNQEKPTFFHVISRESGAVVVTVKAEPFFFFHVVNAYDDSEEIVLDICCYPDAKIFHQLYLHETRRVEAPATLGNQSYVSQLRRYRLPTLPMTETSQVFLLSKQSTGHDYEVISDICFELPRINEKYNRLRHRYVYGACSDEKIDGLVLSKLIKIDVEDKKSLCWIEKGCLVSEPVFIAAPDGEKEDDGVILSSVYDTKKDNSFMLVLDASTFTERARAEVSLRFAPSFHGRFVTKT